MTSGKLRERVEIQQATDALTESGQAVKTWSTYASEYAEVRTPTGRDFFGQDKFNAQVSHVVRIHWNSGVTEKMRVIWGARTLNISVISEDNTHGRWMWLNCLEEKQ